MEVLKWILLSVIVIDLTLLIFAYIKKNPLMKKICECLIIPFAGTIVSLFLSSYLPDSLHLFKVTIIALSLITISTIFISFERYKPLLIAGRILCLSGIIVWISLYREIFFIYSVPAWIIILALCLYIATIIAACILSGIQGFLFYGLFTATFAIAAYLHFCSLTFIIYGHTGSSIMLFCGTSLYTALVAFHFINHAKLKFKHAGVIRYILLVASQVLIACSNILMISGI